MSSMIKIWDLPTRLFHWSLASLFVFMIVSGNSDDMVEWHFYAGYLLSGLLLFRVLWGLLGTRYARFSSFVFHPGETLSYLKSLFSSEHRAYAGHNPIGGLMVFALLLLLAVQSVTGMMSTDDIIWYGPLYNLVDEETAGLAGYIHHELQLILQLLVGLHIFAIIYHKVRFKESLAPAMLHGKKSHAESAQPHEGISWIKLSLAAGSGSALSYYLFTLPI
ncbi:cytochrome b/b6 domain-containing protein [Neptuniibacter halophilus]|uniref:cytochrome b/b6 domain-containing protein n=1 Tax=Neptuniibacter halophilus TaxID=651666 RepID=UPI002572F089|nr:cytochrome b/b6 domain-containing protein [Neptuniibacter halophilus]